MWFKIKILYLIDPDMKYNSNDCPFDPISIYDWQACCACPHRLIDQASSLRLCIRVTVDVDLTSSSVNFDFQFRHIYFVRIQMTNFYCYSHSCCNHGHDTWWAGIFPFLRYIGSGTSEMLLNLPIPLNQDWMTWIGTSALPVHVDGVNCHLIIRTIYLAKTLMINFIIDLGIAPMLFYKFYRYFGTFTGQVYTTISMCGLLSSYGCISTYF